MTRPVGNRTGSDNTKGLREPVRQTASVGIDDGRRRWESAGLRHAERRGKKVHLYEELGKGPVVLSFYVFDFTGVCTGQLCAMRDSMGVLQLHGAKVFGISTDSPASRKAFRAASNGNYPLLSDWNKTVCRRTACCTICGGDLLGVSKRSVFVLDKDGVVRYKWVTEDPKVPPDAKQVLEEVKKLTA